MGEHGSTSSRALRATMTHGAPMHVHNFWKHTGVLWVSMGQGLRGCMLCFSIFWKHTSICMGVLYIIQVSKRCSGDFADGLLTYSASNIWVGSGQRACPIYKASLIINKLGGIKRALHRSDGPFDPHPTICMYMEHTYVPRNLWKVPTYIGRISYGPSDPC